MLQKLHRKDVWDQGFYPHFRDTKESPPVFWGASLGESFFVVSQKWSFPTVLE